MAVAPGEPTRLIEISPRFAELARRAAHSQDPGCSEQDRQAHLLGTVADHLGSGRTSRGPRRVRESGDPAQKPA